MAKRFTATEIWEEDWFLAMPNEYKHFWFYILAKCDHCGIYKLNLRSFRGLLEVNLTPNIALDLFNVDKQRIRVIKDDVWFIEDFFVYQYGPKFNHKNRVHESIAKIYAKYGIDLTSIRGLIDPNDGVKDKDKDKDILGSNEEVGGIEDVREVVGGEEGEKGEVVTKMTGWNKMPGLSEANLLLPEVKAGSALQFMTLMGSKPTEQDVGKLWEIFKVQHFTGSKFYNTENDVFSHFINWSKTQKINGTTTKRTTGSNAPIPQIVTERGTRKF